MSNQNLKDTSLSKNQTITHYTNMTSTLTLTPCSPSSARPLRARTRSVTSPSAVVATPLASLFTGLEHHRGLLPPWQLGAPLRRRLYLHGMYPRAAPRPGAERLPGGVSPQYRVPPSSPLPGNSVKLSDGHTIINTIINMFLLLPPETFQRP